MAERRAALKLPVNGEEVSVPSAAHLRSPADTQARHRFGDEGAPLLTRVDEYDASRGPGQR